MKAKTIMFEKIMLKPIEYLWLEQTHRVTVHKLIKIKYDIEGKLDILLSYSKYFFNYYLTSLVLHNVF